MQLHSAPGLRSAWIACAVAAFLAFPALAEEPAATEDNAPDRERQSYPGGHYGLLRMRDLSPFGFLRLDMRPSHAVSAPAGSWAIEADVGYQNTWALSSNVSNYLKSLPGRRALGPGEIQAIRDLPGEGYLVDMELGLLDVTFSRKLTDHWGVYAVLSGVHYGGGFLDGTIESFHHTFGFDNFGRPAVSRNAVNVILDLKNAQAVYQDLPESGLLDPTFGVRYSAAKGLAPWNLVVEAAVKVPLGGERPFLSTGNTDFGLQVTLQRFMQRHAVYASVAAVYTKGSALVFAQRDQVIPTLILGYEYRLTELTNVLAQAYASQSVFNDEDTDLAELTKPKYALSLGVRHRAGASLLTFAVTENIINFNNSPDIGFQIGWAYSPSLRRAAAR